MEEAVKGGQLTTERLEQENRRLESDLLEARKQSESLKVCCWLRCTFIRQMMGNTLRGQLTCLCRLVVKK